MGCYYARNGTALARDEWQQLQRDRTYCLVKRTVKIGFTIETRWIGWVSDWERGQRRPFFLTERYIVRRAGNSADLCYHQDGLGLWAETEAEALEHHRKLTSEVA